MSVLLPPPHPGNPTPTYHSLPPGVVGVCSAFIAGALVSLSEELRTDDVSDDHVLDAAAAGGWDFWLASRAAELRSAGVDREVIVRAVMRAANRTIAPHVPGFGDFALWAIERSLKAWSVEESEQAAKRVRALQGERLASPVLTFVGAIAHDMAPFRDYDLGFELRSLVRIFVALLDEAGIGTTERNGVLEQLARAFDSIATPPAPTPSRSERPIELRSMGSGHRLPTPSPHAALYLSTCERDAELEALRKVACEATESTRARRTEPITSAMVGPALAMIEQLAAEGELDEDALDALRELGGLDFEVKLRVGQVQEQARAVGRALVLGAFIAAQSAGEERRELMERVALRGLDLIEGRVDEGTFDHELDALMRIGEGWAGAFVDVARGRALGAAVSFARDLAEGLNTESARWALTALCDVIDALATGDEPAVDLVGVFLATGGAS